MTCFHLARPRRYSFAASRLLRILKAPQAHDMATCLAAALSLGLLSAQALAQSPAPGNMASGSITVNGNKTEFKHAYTVVKPSLADNKSETILTLTDKPLSAKALSDSSARSSEMRSNSIQILELTLDADKKIRSVDFSVGTLKGGANTSDYKAEVSRFTATAFAGRVHSGGEQKEFKNVFSFDLRFDTAMVAPRGPDATGKAAWATAQGKVLADFLTAARTGDKATLKRVMMAQQAKQLDGQNARQLLEFLKMSPNPKTAEFDSLIIDGDSAEAKIAERSKNGATASDYKLRLVNSVWFVAM